MTDGIVGLNGQQLTPEQSSIENIKSSILIIEQFCFALNQASIPVRFSESFLKGFSFLNQMHTQLLAQLGPEEVEKMKKEMNPPPPMPPSAIN